MWNSCHQDDASRQIAPIWRMPQATAYGGPDRRRAAASLGPWFEAALDELDYGIVLVMRDAEVVHVNRAGAVALESGHPLHRAGRKLRAGSPRDDASLQAALSNATQRGLRELVSFGDGAQRLDVSVVPLPSGAATSGRAAALLVLPRRGGSGSLSVAAFARRHLLTTAETRVLDALCAGLAPKAIAHELGIAVSTVRTHIGTIRTKTGTDSIRALVWQVAQLPPLMAVLSQTHAVGSVDRPHS